MREYGQIQSSFWTHPKISGLSSDAKLLACYLLTGPHTNGLGCFRCPDGYVVADLEWPEETVSKAFLELIDIVFCTRCNDTDWVLIPDFLEWNTIANPKVAAARIKDAKECPRRASIWPAMVEAISSHGRKHMPKDFLDLLDQEWMPVAARIPEKTRELVIERDKGICAECGTDQDITIDHITPLCYGGTHKPENLRLLCRSCNSKRSVNGFETVSKQRSYPTLPDPTQTQPNPEGSSEGFEDFWSAWPKSARKGGKADCLAKWVRHNLSAQRVEILAHVAAMKDSADWRKNGGEFIPAPAVYLNQKRWDGADLKAVSGDAAVHYLS